MATKALRRRIIPESLWAFPTWHFPLFLREEEENAWLRPFSDTSGLTVSEDDKNIYVEATLPGVKPEEIETSFEKGILWIRAEKKQEAAEKDKNFYSRATDYFSYRLAIPGDVDEDKQPKVICKNGTLKMTFSKYKQGPERKKSSVKKRKKAS